MPRAKYRDGIAPTCSCSDPWECERGGRFPHRSWGYRIAELVTDQDTGRRFRPMESKLQTKKDAERARNGAIAAFRDGRRVDDGGNTINQLFTWWLKEKERRRPALSSNTMNNYRREARVWGEHIGHIKADRLTYADVNNALRRMGEPRDRTQRPVGYHGRWTEQLSIEALKRRHSVLKNMLNMAVTHRKVAVNVAADRMTAFGESVDSETERTDIWTEEIAASPLAPKWGPTQTALFLDSLVGHRWETLFTLYIFTGARRAEWLGARRSALGKGGIQVAGTVRIVKRDHAAEGLGSCPVCGVQHKGRVLVQRTKNLTTTKSLEKTRWMPIPAEGMDLLRRHLIQEDERHRSEAFHFTDHFLIFCDEDGAPIHPGSVTKEFERLVELAGLPRIRLQDLRHNAASLFIASGISIEIVAKMTGHSVEVCRGIYTHLIPELTSELFQRANDTVTRLTRRKWEKPEWARDAYDDEEDELAS